MDCIYYPRVLGHKPTQTHTKKYIGKIILSHIFIKRKYLHENILMLNKVIKTLCMIIEPTIAFKKI